MLDSNKRRYFAMGLAICGALFLVLGYGAYSYHLGNLSGYRGAEAQRYQTEYSERTDQSVARCFSGETSPRECVEKAVKDSHEEQRAERDLQAQEEMADWAFWMLVVSSAGLCVTAIGTVFLAWQVKLTREAVLDTSNATEAMRKANDIAQSQSRAWISIEIIFTNFLIQEEVITVSYIAKYSNIGKTIATNVKTWTLMRESGPDFSHVAETVYHSMRRRKRDAAVELMPGEAVEDWGTATFAINQLPWFGNDLAQQFYLLAISGVTYRIAGDSDCSPDRVTDRTFSIGVKSYDPILQVTINKSSLWSASHQDLVARPTLPWRTT